MKKITFLSFLLMAFLGYSQTDLIESFDGMTQPGFVPEAGGCAPLSMTVSTAQASTGANSLEIIANAAGNPWQGAELILQGSGIDLATNPNVIADVYSDNPAGILAKVTDGGADATGAANHPGGGWQTLTFDLSLASDGGSTPDGVYSNLIFYPLWSQSGGYAGQGTTPCVSDAPNTIYIDNIISTAPTGETCTDGIMNNGETGVDCGGPNCSACPPPTAAPVPTSTDGNTYSIYNDTNSYSTNFPFAYPFGGGLEGEEDLDSGAGVNNAWRFDLGVGGYGQGEETTTGAIDAYGFVSFDYWITAPTSGAATGTGFRFYMISDNTAPVTEVFYEVGTDEVAVTETWTKVVIPMSFFTGGGFDQSEFFQWKLDPFGQSVDNNSILYLDNILFTVQDPLSVNDFETAQFKAFPNPTNGDWNISSNSVINTIEVYDILGKQVTSLAPNATEATIDASSLNTGVYFARIEGVSGSKTVKLVKQ